jgi:hypothetical protein
VDGSTILVIHLVELIDKAKTLVSKNESTTFKCPLASDRIFVNTSSKTDCRGSLTSSVDASMEDLLHILEELRLGGAGVSKEKAIDITSYSVLSIDIF